ncbi:MAG: penicillin acylase family protein [Alphaproteobacteria bacterium]
MGRVGKLYGLTRLAARIGAFAALHRRRPCTLADRLATLPRQGLPLHRPVRIHWNDRQIPFIVAEHDADLAVALGVVHAHLRLAQMEIMRRIAYGRLSEVLGAVAFELDHVLRIVDFPRTVPEILEMMPPATRDWVGRFTDGVNATIAATRRPEEFVLFGLRSEPWRVEDVLALGRLAAIDFSWRVWHRLLSLQDRPDWTDLWSRIVDAQAAPVPSLAGSGVGAAAIDMLWGSLGRGGSNAAAVSATRSASGGALLTSDPHLSVMAPNNWLAAGMASPGHNVVGLMIPGLPVIALGRNRHIAWSGTNLHAASSDLFDVVEHGPDEIRERPVRIAVRWGRPRTVRIRETDHGPIVTDSALVKSHTRRTLALTWIGHRASDEMTAMLGMMRATGWEAFVAATEGYAAPALNFVVADVEGRVGKSMAAHLPRRPPGMPADLAAHPLALSNWDAIIGARDLPRTYDPPEGFVASANDRPRDPTEVPVGFFFSPEERVTRLRDVLSSNPAVTLDDLKALHRDVAMPSAPAMRDLLLAAADGAAAAAPDPGRVERLLATLRDWDGTHGAESAGALAFELLFAHFLHRLHGEDGMALYRASLQPWQLLREDIAQLPRDHVRAAADEAAALAADTFAAHRCWGDIHRLRLAHPLARLPLIGRRYLFADRPVAGTNETLMKTAHGHSTGRHSVGFGANARFVADMSDPDRNEVVLLGGQDGWFGSTTFADQFEMFQRGAYCRLPLSPETARAEFRHETVLLPGAPARSQGELTA